MAEQFHSHPSIIPSKYFSSHKRLRFNKNNLNQVKFSFYERERFLLLYGEFLISSQSFLKLIDYLMKTLIGVPRCIGIKIIEFKKVAIISASTSL